MGSPTAAATPEPPDREDRDGVPFGFPVLAEVPELAALLELAVDAERTTARLLDAILTVEEHGLAVAATGVPLEQWLAIVARSTGADRRMLTTAAKVCRRLPSLRSAFSAGEVSWSQVRAVALKVNRVPSHLDDRLDAELARAIDGAAGSDPDALARIVNWVLADLGVDEPSESGAPAEDVLILQPRLDGTGGTVWGNLGPIGFAALDRATDPGPVGSASRGMFGAAPDADTVATNRLSVGQARAANLIDLCRRDRSDRPARPMLLLRAELDTLLGHSRLPAQLLTTLAGGVVHCDTDTARRLVDTHGTDLRLVILDDGKIAGVGTKTTRPPSWLADATLALHDTCSEPGCPVAARICDLDHAQPSSDDGPTDVDNLAPLCGPSNRRKERDGWTATQTAEGIRTWTHRRTGLTTRTIPATWRPPDPDDRDRRRPAPQASRRNRGSDTRPRSRDHAADLPADPPGDPPGDPPSDHDPFPF